MSFPSGLLTDMKLLFGLALFQLGEALLSGWAWAGGCCNGTVMAQVLYTPLRKRQERL